jgi:catechol 2,3-dioxygenase-like lactoylglutathione lyase family enzyme
MRLLFALMLSVAVIAPAAAEPVPEDQRIAVDFRRTTLLVRDIDQSLPLYRDGLGLNVVYDQLIGGGTDAAGVTTPPTIRLVILRANDSFIGQLGLMQRLDSEPPPRRENRRALAGEAILVFNAKDLDQRWAKIASLPHVTVSTAPERREYPAPGGGVIPVMFSAVWDADGNFIEINQILGAPAGTTPAPTATPQSDDTDKESTP